MEQQLYLENKAKEMLIKANLSSDITLQFHIPDDMKETNIDINVANIIDVDSFWENDDIYLNSNDEPLDMIEQYELIREDPFFYYPLNKEIYAIYDAAKMDYKYELYCVPLYKKLEEDGVLDFNKYYIISVGHEIGHAKQKPKLFEKLQSLTDEETLNNIHNIDILKKHFQKYKKFILKIEREAWELSWDILKNEVDSVSFEAMKKCSLETYQSINIEDDEYFSERYYEIIDELEEEKEDTYRNLSKLFQY